MENISIIECLEEKDKIAGINLLNKAFSGGTNQETLAWHEAAVTHKNYKPLMICARDKDKLVSVCNWLPWEFVFEGKKYLAYQSCEGATEKEYRGKGLWREILKYGDELLVGRGIDFLFCFPGSLSYYPLCMAGYHPVGTFKYRVRIINPFKKNRKENDRVMSEWAWAGLVEKNKITAHADQNYFKWRFQVNPKEYEWVRYDEDNSQALFIVRKSKYYNNKYRIKINELLLLDCQFTSYYEPFVNKAFKYLEARYAKSVFHIRTFFNEHTDRGRAIAPYFPISLRRSRERLLSIPVKGKIDQQILLNFNNWDIMPSLRDNL